MKNLIENLEVRLKKPLLEDESIAVATDIRAEQVRNHGGLPIDYRFADETYFI